MSILDVSGYVRVSTQNQVDCGDGLEIQRGKIRDFCKERGFNLVKFYEDRGISGAIKDRAGFFRIMNSPAPTNM